MVGAGVQAYGQRQAGKQEQKMQEINARQQEQDSLDRQAESIAHRS
jgi:ornithine cyclodeaminase/alanine dehydrogenase-like protein (mu-crystallin family)